MLKTHYIRIQFKKQPKETCLWDHNCPMLTVVIITCVQWDYSVNAAEVTKASSSTAEVSSGREHTLRSEPEHKKNN